MVVNVSKQYQDIVKKSGRACPECGHPTKIIKIKDGFKETCEYCFKKEVEAIEQQKLNEYVRSEKYMWFNETSLFVDKSLKRKTLDNYEIANQEQKEAVEKIKVYQKELESGNPIHGVLVGKVGTGKSHLAMAVCNDLLKTSTHGVHVAFVNWANFHSEALKAREYSDVAEKHNRRLKRLLEADFVVIDDLGAENITQTQEIKQTNFNLISQVLESRHDKPLLITTNKSALEIQETYKERNWSRLSENLKTVIQFKETKDFRKRITW